jgi:hypothetical protein
VPARSIPPSYPPLQARNHLAYDAFGYWRHFYNSQPDPEKPEFIGLYHTQRSIWEVGTLTCHTSVAC